MTNIELTTTEIQSFILKNYLVKTKEEMISDLQVTKQKFGGNMATLKKHNKINKLALKSLELMRDINSDYTSIENKYSNADGVKKQSARIKMMRGIKDSGVKGIIPTLPYKTCTLQQLIDGMANGNTFIGCERDEATYNAMVDTINTYSLPIEAYHGLIGDMLYGKKEDSYAHLILDYCGVLDTFANEIKYAMDNKLIQVGGTIAVTLSKIGIGNKNGIVGELLSKFPKGMFGDINDTELGAKLFFNSLLGDNYEIEEFYNYQDVKKDANGQPILNAKGIEIKKMPMMLIRIKRVK